MPTLYVVQKFRKILIVISGLAATGVGVWGFIGAVLIERSSYGQPFGVISSALLLAASTLILSSLKQKSSVIALAIFGLVFLFPIFGTLRIMSKVELNFGLVSMLSVSALVFLGIVFAIFEQEWKNESGKRLLIHLSIPAFVVLVGFASAVDPGP